MVRKGVPGTSPTLGFWNWFPAYPPLWSPTILTCPQRKMKPRGGKKNEKNEIEGGKKTKKKRNINEKKTNKRGRNMFI